MMTRNGGGLDWSHMHQCEFMINNRVMGLTRRRESDPSRSLKTRPIQRRPLFLQGGQGAGCSYAQVPGSHVRPGVVLEGALPICTAEGHEIGDAVPKAHQGDEGCIC